MLQVRSAGDVVVPSKLRARQPGEQRSKLDEERLVRAVRGQQRGSDSLCCSQSLVTESEERQQPLRRSQRQKAQRKRVHARHVSGCRHAGRERSQLSALCGRHEAALQVDGIQRILRANQSVSALSLRLSSTAALRWHHRSGWHRGRHPALNAPHSLA